MKYLVLVLFLTTSLCGFAQFDNGNSSLSIPPISTPPPSIKPEKPKSTSLGGSFTLPPSIKDKSPESGSSILEIKDNFSFPAKSQNFINPGQAVADKLNQKEGQVVTEVRRNQFLGDFKTKADKVNISYRDFSLVDGDRISVLVNDKVVLQDVTLQGDFQGFELELKPGFNKIDFLALNEGYSATNTAEYEIYDGKKLISANKWFLGTGFKATIILVKE